MADEPKAMTLEEAIAELTKHEWWLFHYPDARVFRWSVGEATDDERNLLNYEETWLGTTWPEAVSAALGRTVVERDDKAELVEALERVYHWMLTEFAEPNPETGEVVELEVRDMFGVVCDALARVRGGQG